MLINDQCFFSLFHFSRRLAGVDLGGGPQCPVTVSAFTPGRRLVDLMHPSDSVVVFAVVELRLFPEYCEFRETCHSVTFIVLVNSHQR